MKKLIKIDRNGTKHFEEEVRCWKCQGRGRIRYFNYYRDGVCFDCDGKGYTIEKTKEYTPEYEAKLEARRAAKEAKRIAEFEAKCKEEQDKVFPDGHVYFVLGNTYEIREELKAAGAIFNRIHGWVFTHPVEDYPLYKVKIEDAFDLRPNGTVEVERIYGKWYGAWPKKVELPKENDEPESQYVGLIDEKLTLTVKYIREFSFESTYGTGFIHVFKDESGNIFKWKTGNAIFHPVDEYRLSDNGITLEIRGTVKIHEEYKGVKETVLTRVKVLKVID